MIITIRGNIIVSDINIHTAKKTELINDRGMYGDDNVGLYHL